MHHNAFYSQVSAKEFISIHFFNFSKIDKESLIIRVGEHDTYLPSNLEKAPHEDGYVADIYIPNNYRADVAFNDLAIIKVKEPFQFRENVVPICSPLSSPEYGSPDIYDPNRCLATGWGKDAYSKKILNIRLLKMHKKLHSLWFSTPNWAGFYLS